MKKLQYSIRELRARRNISQEELARRAGLTSRTIVNYENDINMLRNASYKNIEKISIALDVDITDIFLG